MSASNGNGRAAFLGRPKTAGYRPSVLSGRGLTWGRDGNYHYTPQDGELMRLDGQVSFCLRALYSPLPTVTSAVEAADAEAGEQADTTFKRIWERELAKLFISVAYGWLPGEVFYEADEQTGGVRFDFLGEIHPLDAAPLQRGRKLAGIALRGTAAPAPREGEDAARAHWLLPPRSLWVAHEAEFGSLYGRGRLRAMWLPWMERVGRHGYLDIRRMWFAKNAYYGDVMRYPDGTLEVGDRTMNCRDFAQMVVEQRETGTTLALPNTRQGEDGTGEYEWTIEPAASNGDVAGVLEYGDRLDRELFLAAGIPPEMVDAASSGSGWSGRNVPNLLFLKGADGMADGIAQAVWGQIVMPLVAANHGEAAARGCRLKLKSLVPEGADGDDPTGGKAGSGGGPPQAPPPPMQGGAPGVPPPPGPPPVQMSQDHGPPPRPGLVFDEQSHRWTRPGEGTAGAGAATQADATPATGLPSAEAVAAAHASPEALAAAGDKAADGIIARGKGAVAALMAWLDESTANKPVIGWVNAASKWAGGVTSWLYGKLEERYGRTTAVSVFASGSVLGWGITGASFALTGVPVAFPGMGTLLCLPGLAAAEVYKQMRGASRMAADAVGAALSMEEIRKLAEEMGRKLMADFDAWTKENPLPEWEAPAEAGDAPALMSLDDALQLANDAASHSPGDTWKGPSGRWFTKRPDGRTVPAKAPGGGEKAAPARPAPAKPKPAAAKKPAAKATPEAARAAAEEAHASGDPVKAGAAFKAMKMGDLRAFLAEKGIDVKDRSLAGLADKAAKALVAKAPAAPKQEAPPPPPKPATPDPLSPEPQPDDPAADARLDELNARFNSGARLTAGEMEEWMDLREGKTPARATPPKPDTPPPAPEAKPAPAGPADEDAVMSSVAAAFKSGPNIPVLVGRARAASGLKGEDFDRAMMEMVDAGLLQGNMDIHPGAVAKGSPDVVDYDGTKFSVLTLTEKGQAALDARAAATAPRPAGPATAPPKRRPAAKPAAAHPAAAATAKAVRDVEALAADPSSDLSDVEARTRALGMDRMTAAQLRGTAEAINATDPGGLGDQIVLSARMTREELARKIRFYIMSRRDNTSPPAKKQGAAK